MQINLFHILIIGPLLLALDHFQHDKQKRMDLFKLLAFTSGMILFFVKLPIPELGWTSWYNIISLSHYFIWIWVFGWIAYLGLTENEPSWVYPLLRGLGIMVIVIHGYLLFFKNL